MWIGPTRIMIWMNEAEYFLKPCPLCGHEVYLTYEDLEGDTISVATKDNEFDRRYIDVECVCGLCLSISLSRIPSDTDPCAHISEIWNTRIKETD